MSKQETTLHNVNWFIKDPKPETGQHLSNLKKNQNQNPEPDNQVQDQKQSQQDSPHLRERMSKMWRELSTLKKTLAIGGTVLFIVIVILFCLLLASLRSKPKFIVVSSKSTPFPYSKEELGEYIISMRRKGGLFRNDTNVNMTISTVRKTPNNARSTQQIDEGQNLNLQFSVVQFQDQNDGITIKSSGKDNFQASINLDQMIQASFQGDRRLLFQIEMRASLRRMQYEDSSNSFANPQDILSNAQDSLRDTFASVLQASQDNVWLEQTQQVLLKETDQGKYVFDVNNQQSSRLLSAFINLRTLQDGEKDYWGQFFQKIADKTLKSRLEQAKAAVTELADPENIKNMDNEELKATILNSNLNGEVQLIIEQGQSSVRLLQVDDIQTNLASQANDQPKQQRKKGGNYRTVSNSHYKDCAKCCKKGKKVKCDKQVVKNPQSVYYVEGTNNEISFNSSSLERRFRITWEASLRSTSDQEDSLFLQSQGSSEQDLLARGRRYRNRNRNGKGKGASDKEEKSKKKNSTDANNTKTKGVTKPKNQQNSAKTQNKKNKYVKKNTGKPRIFVKPPTYIKNKNKTNEAKNQKGTAKKTEKYPEKKNDKNIEKKQGKTAQKKKQTTPKKEEAVLPKKQQTTPKKEETTPKNEEANSKKEEIISPKKEENPKKQETPAVKKEEKASNKGQKNGQIQGDSSTQKKQVSLLSNGQLPNKQEVINP